MSEKREKKLVLLVESRDIEASVLTFALSPYTVVRVSTGQDIISCLTTMSLDLLVISQWWNAQVRGMELYEKARLIDSSIPVLLVGTERTIREDGLIRLQKLFTYQEFAQAVEALLEEQTALTHIYKHRGDLLG